SGRLEAEKGIFTMLDAMPQVLSEHPRARLVVAGNGGQSHHFDHDIVERGLAGSVVRSGWLPEADLRALVGSADAALVPSLYEPFGLVALEAMALGAPVICARTGGLVDIVDDGVTGLLFEPGNPTDLAAAIDRTLNDPAAAADRAAAAAAPLRARFNWSNIADATVAEYRNVAASVRGSAQESDGS
ncbi:MAG: glycosyltransferase family 4 protein, partial [Actinobacteria bacterium]|nr:glycosyltransferase family 4 protein [Actinomycetota bacterium]